MSKTVVILGGKGMLGRAIYEQIEKEHCNVFVADLPELDLRNERQTYEYFEKVRPDEVYFLAAIAGGVEFRKQHADTVLSDNLKMILNVMHAAKDHGCKKVLNISSALIYPESAKIPYSEAEITHVDFNDVETPYTLPKAVSIELAKYLNRKVETKYLTAIPCNFFGPYAPFEGNKMGVIPSLIDRMHRAKMENIPSAVVWGTGNACRELLSSSDVAKACITLMENENQYDLYNIGRGMEFSMREIATTIKKVVGYEGELVFDATKPEGKQHTKLNTERIFSTGWKPEKTFEEGVRETYDWYLKNVVK